MADFNGGDGPERFSARDEGVYGERNLLLGNGGDDTLVGGGKVDTLDGGEGDDRLTGNEGRDFLEGRAGNDRLDGGDGADQIIAFDGDDTALGGVGDDLIEFGGGDQMLDGGDGDDFIRWTSFQDGFVFKIDCGLGDDSVAASSGADRIDGGEGVDFVDYFAFAAVKIDLAAHVFKGGAAGDRLTGVEQIGGSIFGDTIVGTAADNVITGESGNDVLFGGLGSDLLVGSFGSDRIDGGPSAAGDRDTLIGDGEIVDSDAEFDTLVLASATSGVVADLSGGFAKGGLRATISGFEKIEGSDFDDELRGTDDSSRDGNDTLEGAAGNDRLEGRGGDDLLQGGQGDDTLEGGLGRDVLTGGGGGGRDVFVYASVADSSNVVGASDVIIDFSHDDGDRINLSKIDADTTADGRQGFDFIKKGPFENAGDLRYERAGSGLILFGDTDGDGDEDFVLEVANVTSIGKGDFMLG